MILLVRRYPYQEIVTWKRVILSPPVRSDFLRSLGTEKLGGLSAASVLTPKCARAQTCLISTGNRLELFVHNLTENEWVPANRIRSFFAMMRNS